MSGENQKIGFFIHLNQVVMSLPERWTHVYFTPEMARNAAAALIKLAEELEKRG